jgi:hypothetical protein
VSLCCTRSICIGANGTRLFEVQAFVILRPHNWFKVK